MGIRRAQPDRLVFGELRETGGCNSRRLPLGLPGTVRGFNRGGLRSRSNTITDHWQLYRFAQAKLFWRNMQVLGAGAYTPIPSSHIDDLHTSVALRR